MVLTVAYDYGDYEEMLSIHATLSSAMNSIHKLRPWKWRYDEASDKYYDGELFRASHQIVSEVVLP